MYAYFRRIIINHIYNIIFIPGKEAIKYNHRFSENIIYNSFELIGINAIILKYRNCLLYREMQFPKKNPKIGSNDKCEIHRISIETKSLLDVGIDTRWRNRSIFRWHADLNILNCIDCAAVNCWYRCRDADIVSL